MPKQDGGTATTQSVMTPEECFVAQITELLTQYGRIDYCGLTGAAQRGMCLIKHVSFVPFVTCSRIPFVPTCGILTRWCGNEEGYCDSTTKMLPIGSPYPCEHRNGRITNHTLFARRMRSEMRDTWFDANNASTVKSPQTLNTRSSVGIQCRTRRQYADQYRSERRRGVAIAGLRRLASICCIAAGKMGKAFAFYAL